MGQKKLLKLILQELNSINSKLYRPLEPMPKIAMKQRVTESPFEKRMVEVASMIAEDLEREGLKKAVRPQVGMLDALQNPQGPKIIHEKESIINSASKPV